MSDIKDQASVLLKGFKGENYAFGRGILDEAPGKFASELGKKALFVAPLASEWFQPIKDRIIKSLGRAGIDVIDMASSASPNAPFVDVYRIHSHIMHKKPDMVVVAGGGSGIDCSKAAATLATLGDILPLFLLYNAYLQLHPPSHVFSRQHVSVYGVVFLLEAYVCHLFPSHPFPLLYRTSLFHM